MRLPRILLRLLKGTPKRDTDLFGRLVYDFFDEAWSGEIRLPLFADCYARWQYSAEISGDVIAGPYDDSREQKEKDGIVSIRIKDQTGTGPSTEQAAAISFLKTRQHEVRSVILTVLLKNATEFYFDDDRRNLASANAREVFNQQLAPFQSPDGIHEMIELLNITFLEHAVDGMALMSFDFHCAWDEEHGVAVLVHARGEECGNRCLAAGVIVPESKI